MANPIILTVDDTPSVRSLVGKLVAKIGFDIVEAGNGREGLGKLAEIKQKKTPPKLIITDLNMPTMDGIAFIRAVRKEDMKTPILMLTTIDADEKKVEGKKAGANGWLTKPISPNLFLDTIRKMVAD
ncbi:MAG: response regulator [Magnetococcales bacterium]|nr:response regulator [Magnetococcales bacterium]